MRESHSYLYCVSHSNTLVSFTLTAVQSVTLILIVAVTLPDIEGATQSPIMVVIKEAYLVKLAGNIKKSVLRLTGPSGQCDMTYYELPSRRSLVRSEEDKVIFIVCRGSKIYDKNNPDLLARAVHLKRQNLSYLNS